MLDYDRRTLTERIDPSVPPDPVALAVAKEVLGLFPPAVQRHVHARRHLERTEFVAFLAKAGAPLLRGSVSQQADLRNRILRAVFARRSGGAPANTSDRTAPRDYVDFGARGGRTR